MGIHQAFWFSDLVQTDRTLLLNGLSAAASAGSFGEVGIMRELVAQNKCSFMTARYGHMVSSKTGSGLSVNLVGHSATVSAGTLAADKTDIYLDYDYTPESTGYITATVANYYNGGTDGQGNTGPSWGVVHSSTVLRLDGSDSLAGPQDGNYSNMPSKDYAIFWITGTSVYISVAAGFTGYARLAYQAPAGSTADIKVFDGADNTGSQLGSTLTLSEVNSAFGSTQYAQLSFPGIGKTLRITGNANFPLIDSITLGNNPANHQVFKNIVGQEIDLSLAGGTATVTFNSDGTITNTGSALCTPFGWWANKQLTGVGNNYWIRATILAGSVNSGTTGSWLAMSSNRTWTVTAANTRLKFEIASDAAGTTIVASTNTNASVNDPRRDHYRFIA